MDKKKLLEKWKRIFELCVLINMETDYCAFCGLSGHVCWLQVSVRRGKEDWKECLYESYRMSYGVEGEEAIAEEMTRVDECIETLETYLKDEVTSNE